MPVLVTNADRQPELAVALAIAALGGEVRAFCTGDGDVAALRAAGVYVSIGTPDDEGRLEAALEQVHTAIHLDDPALAPGARTWAARAAVVLRASVAAGVRRMIVRSVPGADLSSDDELLAACGAWERAVAQADPPSVVVRAALVDTDRLRDALASALPPDLRDQPVAPVAVADLAAGVEAIDDARGAAETGHVVFRLAGETTTVGAHLLRVAPDGMVGRTYVTRDAVPLLPMAVALPLTADPDAADLRTFAP